MSNPIIKNEILEDLKYYREKCLNAEKRTAEIFASADVFNSVPVNVTHRFTVL
jgi:hypothetical protein